MRYLEREMGMPGVHRWHLSAVRRSSSSKLWQQVIRLLETERSDSSVDRKCYTILFAAGDAYGPRTPRASAYTTIQRNEEVSTMKSDQQGHVVEITGSSQDDPHLRSEIPQTAEMNFNQGNDFDVPVQIVDAEDTSADPFDLLLSKPNVSGKKANNKKSEKGQKGRKAAKPSAPTFEGYTFTVLDDKVGQSTTWMRTRKVQMPFTNDEIYKQAVTAQGKSGLSASNQFSELEHTQQLIISRLLADKNDNKKGPDAPWHLFNVEKLHKKSRRRFRTIKIENAIRVTIVHQGEQRDAGLRASDAMGSRPFDEEILDLAEPRKAKKNKTKANKAGKKKVSKAAVSASDDFFQGWEDLPQQMGPDPFAPAPELYTLKDPSEPHPFQPHDSHERQLQGSGKQYQFAQAQAPEGVIGSVPIPQNEIPWHPKAQLQASLPATSYSQSYRHALEDRACIPPGVGDYDSLSESEGERSHPHARHYRILGKYTRQGRPIGPSGSASGGLDERPESELEISGSDNESRDDGDLCDEVLLRFTGHKLHEETTGSGGDDHTGDHVETRDPVKSW